MRWKIGNPAIAAAAVFEALFVALLVVPENPVAAVTGGAYTPLIAAFLSALKSDFLPRGWQLIGPSGGSLLQVELTAAAMVALVADSPLISLSIIGRLVPAGSEDREFLVKRLAVAATLALAVGILLGLFFLVRFLIIVSVGPFFEAASLNPAISATGFYFHVFQAILIAGAMSLVPAYAIMRVKVHSMRSFRA